MTVKDLFEKYCTKTEEPSLWSAPVVGNKKE